MLLTLVSFFISCEKDNPAPITGGSTNPDKSSTRRLDLIQYKSVGKADSIRFLYDSKNVLIGFDWERGAYRVPQPSSQIGATLFEFPLFKEHQKSCEIVLNDSGQVIKIDEVSDPYLAHRYQIFRADGIGIDSIEYLNDVFHNAIAHRNIVKKDSQGNFIQEIFFNPYSFPKRIFSDTINHIYDGFHNPLSLLPEYIRVFGCLGMETSVHSSYFFSFLNFGPNNILQSRQNGPWQGFNTWTLYKSDLDAIHYYDSAGYPDSSFFDLHSLGTVKVKYEYSLH